jgi:hypothetical protein
MNVAETPNIETVLKIVRDWPPEQRSLLVREIVKTLETPSHARRDTLGRALGLLATDRPAPTDAERDRGVVGGTPYRAVWPMTVLLDTNRAALPRHMGDSL